MLKLKSILVKSWSGASNSIDEKVEKEKEQEKRMDLEEEEYNIEFDVGKVSANFLFDLFQ